MKLITIVGIITLVVGGVVLLRFSDVTGDKEYEMFQDLARVEDTIVGNVQRMQNNVARLDPNGTNAENCALLQESRRLAERNVTVILWLQKKHASYYDAETRAKMEEMLSVAESFLPTDQELMEVIDCK